jgi:hypothetical protein
LESKATDVTQSGIKIAVASGAGLPSASLTVTVAPGAFEAPAEGRRAGLQSAKMTSGGDYRE